MDAEEEYADEHIPTEQELGMSTSEKSGYLTGNDSNEPDTPAALDDIGGASITDVDQPSGQPQDDAVPGAGNSQVGLGGAIGTERFDEDARDADSTVHDQAQIGDADFRTQEAVYNSWEQAHAEEYRESQ